MGPAGTRGSGGPSDLRSLPNTKNDICPEGSRIRLPVAHGTFFVPSGITSDPEVSIQTPVTCCRRISAWAGKASRHSTPIIRYMVQSSSIANKHELGTSRVAVQPGRYIGHWCYQPKT